ncbi:hypothetical protein Q5Y75_26600 [Ruegeria sp. 2205SS24-7]|uniref:hypothetical protein n=1 Tax=Ruegeria discodermiae TaxID=3064389 RepID=UPI0027404D48|nr:hypothetical protein [Ruegeria sp. 2205SS24-7]MDP5220763.1 hypothetical protein [Ruegeria sp. 2205SS24-7]
MTSSEPGFDASYPGVSPQLMARTRQLWSARGLDLDAAWRGTVRQLKGYQPVVSRTGVAPSFPEDVFFLFDQSVIWISALQCASETAGRQADSNLDPEQWLAVRHVLGQLLEKLAAIRMLSLADFSAPTMQIARSVSEDADMIVLFLTRPKLAARFVECRSKDEATGFWRKHIAGGRAFRSITEQLYRSGLDFDTDGSYARWRKDALGVLSLAVHTSFGPQGTPPSTQEGAAWDCLYFVTLRVQEIFAYSHIVSVFLQADLDRMIPSTEGAQDANMLRASAAARDLVLEQYKWMSTADLTIGS